MRIKKGKGTTEFGKGINIKLTGSEIATAIYTYLTAHDVHIQGAATIRINDELIAKGSVYIDPSGYVVSNGKKYNGRTGKKENND